jgi:S1-C subfamily serine protease
VLFLQVYLVDARGNGFYREAKIVGVDPAYDLAVLKVFNQIIVQFFSIIYAHYH